MEVGKTINGERKELPPAPPALEWVTKKERLESPSNWAAWQHAALGTRFWEHVALNRPIQIFSCFAGTGADVQAAKKLLGDRNVKSVGCDTRSASADWFMAAHKPDHFWRDDAVRVLRDRIGYCTLRSI